MNLYIRGTGILSPVGSSGSEQFLKHPPQYETDRLICQEPDYSAYIPPMQLRRMSKAVRMGIGAARICLEDAGVEKADAISVGTALGCIQDTEVFLSKMVDQDEQMLTPTAFIQSTHNTVAGQIALVTGCHGHNLTYVHRGLSFEHAMINAQLYLDEHEEQSILVGGIEELTESSIEVFKGLNVYRKEASTAESVIRNSSTGSVAGEGANFFLVSKRSEGAQIVIKDISTFVGRDIGNSALRVRDFIERQGLEAEDIDLALLGINGDARSVAYYNEVRGEILRDASHAVFKHLCGEYPVAGSFGLGVLSHGLGHGLTDFLFLNSKPKKLKRIVMINNFLHHYSCWLIEVV